MRRLYHDCMRARSRLRNARFVVHLLAGLAGAHCATAQVITTIAGSAPTFASVPALNVPLGILQGVAVDAQPSRLRMEP